MATSLKRQLAALSVPASSLLQQERRKSSILFTPSEAASYDRETFYQIGIEGLDDLIEVDPNLFDKFRDSMIFNEASKRLQRAVLSVEENKKLDDVIEEFLISLSPFMMLKASLKCIEWLINRFHIERFNISSILKCIFPYHDTRPFVLIIQALQIGKYKENSMWEWLIPYVKSGSTLCKGTLHSNAKPLFVQWLFNTLNKFMSIHEEHNLKIFYAFFTSTIVGIIKFVSSFEYGLKRRARQKLIANNVYERIFLLMKKMKSNQLGASSEEKFSMFYIILSALHSFTKDIQDVYIHTLNHLPQFISLLLKTYPEEMKTQSYLLANYLASSIPSYWKLEIENVEKVMENITLLSGKWDFSYLALKLLATHTGAEDPMRPKIIWNFLINPNFTFKQRGELFKVVYLNYTESSSIEAQKWASGFLSKFETNCPTEFSLILADDPSFAKELTNNRKSSNLYILAQHADLAIRREAVRKVVGRAKKMIGTAKVAKGKVRVISDKSNKEKTIKKNSNPIAKALFDRFTDDDENIMKMVLTLKVKVLKKLYTIKILIRRLLAAAEKKNYLNLSIKKLCIVAAKLPKGNKLRIKIMKFILPFLFPKKNSELKIVMNSIVNSPLANEDSFLKKFSEVKENATVEEFCKFSYKIACEKNSAIESFPFNMTNPLDISLNAFLVTPSIESLDNLMLLARKFGCFTSDSISYPVTEENIGKLLPLIVKNGKLSLELAYSKLAFLPQGSSKNENEELNFIDRVTKFVWIQAEFLDRRNLSMRFITEFFKKHLKDEKEKLSFIKSSLMVLAKERENLSKNEDLIENELYTLRTIQLATKVLPNCLLGSKIQEFKVEPEPQCSSPPSSRMTRSAMAKIKDSPSKPTTPIKTTTKVVKQKDEAEEKKAASQELLLSALPFIVHDSFRVRKWAFEALKSMNLDGETDEFVKFLIQYENEIVGDPEHSAYIAIADGLAKKKFASIKLIMIKKIVEPDTEEIVAFSLARLCKFTTGLFDNFFLLVKHLLKKNSNSKFFFALLECFDCSSQALQILPDLLKNPKAAVTILEKFTKVVFNSFAIAVKKNVFTHMIDASMNCEVPEEKVAIQRTVRKWNLDASIVAFELEKCLMIQKRQAQGSTPVIKKKNERENVKRAKPEEEKEWTKRTEVVLELSQSKRLFQKTLLIAPLFKLLKICILREEQSPIEYLKQLILTSLTICCEENENPTEKEAEHWSSFNVEIVIDCLRCSRNPQTHHHALILLNYAAKRYPEQVLHGIMSLFTFMGNSILRQDDSYSTQLIQKTVTCLIPTLTNKAVSQLSKDLISAGIIRVFVSAVQDIPVHRRVPIFVSLVETLGHGSLAQMCIIIVDHTITKDKKRSQFNESAELAYNIAWNFEPTAVLQAMEAIYTNFTSIPIYEKMTENQFQHLKTTYPKTTIDVSRKQSLRDLQIVILYTLELVSKICGKFGDKWEGELPNMESLLSKCLSFSRTLSTLIHEDKILKLMNIRNHDVIDKVNGVLEPPQFVGLLSSLLDSDAELIVKKKMMDMLNQKIIQNVEWFEKLKILLDLIPSLLRVGQLKGSSEEEVTIVQISMFSLKLIARYLAQQYPESFVPVFQFSFNLLTSENNLLFSSALLTIGELFCLKSLILPNLAEVTEGILKSIDIALMEEIPKEDVEISEAPKREGNSGHLLCLSSMTCLTKLTENLGSFLGVKFIRKCLFGLLTYSIRFEETTSEAGEVQKKGFDQRIKLLLKTISLKIPLRHSLKALKKTFEKMAKQKKSLPLVAILNLVKDSLKEMEKGDFKTILPSLTDAFLRVFFPLRENWSGRGDLAIDEVEDSIIDAFVSGIVLKLSEGNFRPIYHKIFDWAQEDDNIERLITFYRLSEKGAKKLKSLFVTFTSYVITGGAKTLAETKNLTLTKSILKFFYNVFSNDKEGFVSLERFNLLLPPITDLMDSEMFASGELESELLLKTILQLGVASNDLSRWQEVVERVGYKSRDTNPKVRMFVVDVIGGAANELGKEFIPLLPPAVPFLAELLNDEDAEVETETQKMLLKLENIAGEPLQPYFTT